MTADKPAPSRPSRWIEKHIEVHAVVEEVWTALTNPEELILWFPLEAEVAPGAGGLFANGVEKLAVGGRYSLRAATGDSFSGRVEFIVPPRGFCLTVDGLNGVLY